jgi:hypothetical protein
LRLIEYFTLIRRSVLLDARIFLQTKQEMESSSKEELEEQLMNMSDLNQEERSRMTMKKEILGDKTPYLERERGYG